jgi:CheY-like chemotaxis protein
MQMTEPAAAAFRLADVSILLVEDDHGDAVLVQACLEDAGVAQSAISWRRTLADALDAVAGRPGCILLDLGLPDAAGDAAIDQMVAAAPDIAVIVLTGRQERDGVAALAAGAQDYLAKDLITGELLERSIRYAIERKRAQATHQQLRDARLTAVEQARLERGLLPTPLLWSGTAQCATYYRPGRDDAVLGGDFFDVVETPDGRIRAVVGDVMGHGPDEAAVGVHLRVAWRTLLLAGTPDERILPVLAQLLSHEGDHISRWATVCDIAIDGPEMTVRLAGHPAPIVCGERTAQYLDLKVGLPLGVEIPGRPAADWPTTRVPLPPGASVVLYTDGLLDAYDPGAASADIGVPELVAAVGQCVREAGTAQSWIPDLLARAPRESVDDTAVVVLTVQTAG